MKPIAVPKEEAGPFKENLIAYKPVYKYACITDLSSRRENGTIGDGIKSAAKPLTKPYDHVYLAKSGPGSGGSDTNLSCSNRETTARHRRHCIDEYVDMSEAIGTGSSLPKTPIPSPRTFEIADINFNPDKASPPRSTRAPSLDRNNNKAHSQTPEFPPPSVTQAEHTILEFMQPLNPNNKRNSISVKHNKNIDLEYINKEDSPESLSSRCSDCVEEFVGDVPFAGLFKGSTLNLASDDRVDISPLELQPSGLRSPTLVKAIKPIPAKRNLSLKKPSENPNETKLWDEINTIFESIGYEVSNAKKSTNTDNHNEAKIQDQTAHIEVPEKHIQIRDPFELLLGVAANNRPTNWCHSANKLIKGDILYNVYYLGSTVIKKLQGTVSTRKSILKLKRNEMPYEPQHEVSVLEDCNNSTKLLKANNQQTRLKVGLALSHIGVKFIDLENKSTICMHEIVSIDCVCQDAEDLRYFAYITGEQGIHYCQVFMVDSLELATEIIMTLGQAFEVAYQLTLRKKNGSIEEQPTSNLNDADITG